MKNAKNGMYIKLHNTLSNTVNIVFVYVLRMDEIEAARQTEYGKMNAGMKQSLCCKRREKLTKRLKIKKMTEFY